MVLRRIPAVAVAALLLHSPAAFAGFQAYGTVDLTWTLGAKIPIGLALGVAAGAATRGDVGLEGLAFGELGFTPGQPVSISVGARVGPEMLLDQSEWFYLPGLSTHGEVGWTFRPASWGGLRVGGDVTWVFLTARYHQVVRIGAAPPAPTSPLPLPGWGGVDPERGMTIGLGTAAWLLPRPWSDGV